MESIRTQLKDMGFHEAKIERAIKSCPDAQTLEQVMEWLIQHEEDPIEDTSANVKQAKSEATTNPKEVQSESKTSTNAADGNGASETAASMAASKKITLEEAQRIITERQAKRLEEERKKEIEDEKRRRMDGQKMAETRAELQDQERIRLAQQIRQEKLEKELHKKRVLEQIARDREAMRNKNNPVSVTPESPVSTSTSSNKSAKQAPTECRIALRFPDGSSLLQKFSPQEQLSAVRLYVQIEKQSSKEIEFIVPPNKKLDESMMNNTLENLGLCPGSRLEVKFKNSEWSDLD